MLEWATGKGAVVGPVLARGLSALPLHAALAYLVAWLLGPPCGAVAGMLLPE